MIYGSLSLNMSVTPDHALNSYFFVGLLRNNLQLKEKTKMRWISGNKAAVEKDWRWTRVGEGQGGGCL